jgi:hypothetical protein
MGIIKEFQGENRWLSNFSSVDIEYDGKTYPTVEHAYCAHKSLNDEWRLYCTNPLMHPSEVKKKGKDVKLRSDWEEVKITLMEELLKIKYNIEPYKTKLINTKNDYIQEGNMWGDKYWGFCLKTNEGENILGNIIMNIRKDIITNKNNYE